MSLSQPIAADDMWSRLQQPTHPSETEPNFRQLLAALDQGWHVAEPVYLRSRWGDSGPRTYHFILRPSPLASPRLLTVPAHAAVEQLVHHEGWRVLTD